MKKTIVPVAYVTKYATTAGILVVRGAERSGMFPERLWLNHGHILPSDWTEDKAEAEMRWHAALLKAAAQAEKKAARLRAAASHAPKYSEL